MKKLHFNFSVLAVLLSACLCFGQTSKDKPQTQTPATPQADKSAQQTATAQAKNMLDDTLISNERRIWDALKGKDTTAFTGFVAEDAWILDETGPISRAMFVQGMPDFNVTEYTLDEPRVVWLNKDVAVLTYRTGLKGTFRGQNFPTNPAQHTTIWVNRNGKWVAAFHQMTPMTATSSQVK